jgi:hypothetical protein
VVEKELVATTRMEEEEGEGQRVEEMEEMEESRQQEAEQRNGGGESILNGDSGEPSSQGFFLYLKYYRIQHLYGTPTK